MGQIVAIILVVSMFCISLWQRGKDDATGTFLTILSGGLNIGYGIYIMDANVGYVFVMLGIAFISTGVFQLFKLAYDLVKGR